jgi:hypothetical protein
MANITDFISQVKTQGLMRLANYSVVIGTPISLLQFGITHLEKIQMFCDSISIPGSNIASAPNRSYGEVREAPYEKLYGTITLTFFVDNTMQTKQLFDNWINTIQNPVNRTFEFYNNYVTDILIHVENIQEESKYDIKIFECYPKVVSPIQMGYGLTEVMKLEVEFNYKYWKQLKAEETESFLTPADYNLGYNDAWMQDYSKFQKQFNTYVPESTGIFTGITKF